MDTTAADETIADEVRVNKILLIYISENLFHMYKKYIDCRTIDSVCGLVYIKKILWSFSIKLCSRTKSLICKVIL